MCGWVHECVFVDGYVTRCVCVGHLLVSQGFIRNFLLGMEGGVVLAHTVLHANH